VWKLKKFRLPEAVLIVIVGALVTYLLRGGFLRFEIKPYPVPPAAFTNWNDVLAHLRDISLTTIQTGVVHMDALSEPRPRKPQASRLRSCAARSRRAGSLGPRDFLIDTGFDDSFAKHPPYGNYTEACVKNAQPPR
jgi:hypothetical protein